MALDLRLGVVRHHGILADMSIFHWTPILTIPLLACTCSALVAMYFNSVFSTVFVGIVYVLVGVSIVQGIVVSVTKLVWRARWKPQDCAETKSDGIVTFIGEPMEIAQLRLYLNSPQGQQTVFVDTIRIVPPHGQIIFNIFAVAILACVIISSTNYIWVQTAELSLAVASGVALFVMLVYQLWTTKRYVLCNNELRKYVFNIKHWKWDVQSLVHLATCRVVCRCDIPELNVLADSQVALRVFLGGLTKGKTLAHAVVATALACRSTAQT